MTRPTPKELHHKITAAQNSVRKGRIAFLNQTAIACDAIDLEYDIEHDLLSFLPECLHQLTPAEYAGRRPPEKAYATEISGLELFAFKIEKSPFRAPVYIKFTHVDDVLWLVSFHRNRAAMESR
jgi:hypothetical protein